MISFKWHHFNKVVISDLTASKCEAGKASNVLAKNPLLRLMPSPFLSSCSSSNGYIIKLSVKRQQISVISESPENQGMYF